MEAEQYPFVQELITDKKGKITKVVLDYEDYQRLLDAIEDKGLFFTMQSAQAAKLIRLNQALHELERAATNVEHSAQFLII
jgi:hypothetical protein